jgi:hypothetical protein
VREENSGSTREFIQNYLLFTFISNLILAIHMQIVNGFKEPFQDSREKLLQPTHSGCKKGGRLSNAKICPANRIYPANRKCVLENFHRTAAEQQNICPVLGTNADTSS